MAKLMGIAVKRSRESVKMDVLDSAEITIDTGVIGDYRGTFGEKRRVSILSEEQWSVACRVTMALPPWMTLLPPFSDCLTVKTPWTARMANLLVSGHKFTEGDKGKKLRIGKEVVLEITGPMSARMKASSSPEWRGGVNCHVIKGGAIKVGDEINLE